MRFGLIANFRRPDASETVNFVIEWCKKNRYDVLIGEDEPELHKLNAPVVPRKELAPQVDFIISLGGDGTMLATARAMGTVEKPILGVNLGQLGFLTQLTPDQLEVALGHVADGNYQVEERLILKTEIVDGEQLEYPYALNDIVIDRGGVSRVINLSLYCGDEYICSYTADGLIVATPTGSTAYSLAVGGPILNPKMKAFIASPISPFSLTSRPIVFPADLALEVRIRSEHGQALLTIDGQVATRFSATGSIKVSKAKHSIKFITFADSSFYDILRRKLHWGRLPVVDYEKVDLLKRNDSNNNL